MRDLCRSDVLLDSEWRYRRVSKSKRESAATLRRAMDRRSLRDQRLSAPGEDLQAATEGLLEPDDGLFDCTNEMHGACRFNTFPDSSGARRVILPDHLCLSVAALDKPQLKRRFESQGRVQEFTPQSAQVHGILALASLRRVWLNLLLHTGMRQPGWLVRVRACNDNHGRSACNQCRGVERRSAISMRSTGEH